MLQREVLPVLRRRLEVAAIFVGSCALTFWVTAMW
jgi:hypothetical protein